VLQALEKLEERHTFEQGSRQLHEVLGGLLPDSKEELAWFLRTVFDERKPLHFTKGRREQLLLLVHVAQHFGRLLVSTGALQDRVLPCLLHALRTPDMQDTVARAICEILHTLAADGDADTLLAVFPLVTKTCLEPLVQGTGWEVDVKHRSVSVLAALTSTLLNKLSALGEARGNDVELMVGNYATLLVQCMAVNPGVHEGLLLCLSKLAACHGSSIVPHACRLAELCTVHLIETPSGVPDYVQEQLQKPDRVRSESPKRGTLTRELARVCCLCLQHIAADVAPLLKEEQGLVQQHGDVVAALSRENLNLQRLTRGTEPLRQAIVDASQAWHRLKTGEVFQRPGSDMSALGGPLQRDRAFSQSAQLHELAQLRDMGPFQDLAQRRHSSAGRSRQQGPPLPAPPLASLPPPLAPLPARVATAKQRQGWEAEQPRREVLEAESDGREHVARSLYEEEQPDPLAMRQRLQPGLRPRPPELLPVQTASLDAGALAGYDPAMNATDEHRLAASVLDEACCNDSDTVKLNPFSEAAEAADAHARLQATRFPPQRELELEDSLDERPRSPMSYSELFEAAPPGETAGMRVSQGPANEGGLRRPFASRPTAEQALEAQERQRQELEAQQRQHREQHYESAMEDLRQRCELRDREVEELKRAMEDLESNRREQHLEAMRAQRVQVAGAARSAAKQLRSCGVNTQSRQRSEASQTEAAQKAPHFRGGAGHLPAAGVPADVVCRPSSADAAAAAARNDPAPSRPIDWTLALDGEAPYSSAALRYVAAGRIDQAFQCVFRFGNEKTLGVVLKRLPAVSTWQQLGEHEARYLAHLLVLLICKDPLTATAIDCCCWLDGLLHAPAGRNMLAAEDLPGLQGALFNLSGAAGEPGMLASSIYYQLFQTA